jgi:hypothetical protein
MINIDLNKAKIIWKNKIRIDRLPILQYLDVQFLRAVETGDLEEQNKIKNKKQLLRDATLDPRINEANSPDQLKSIDPVSEIGYSL